MRFQSILRVALPLVLASGALAPMVIGEETECPRVCGVDAPEPNNPSQYWTLEVKDKTNGSASEGCVTCPGKACSVKFGADYSGSGHWEVQITQPGGATVSRDGDGAFEHMIYWNAAENCDEQKPWWFNFVDQDGLISSMTYRCRCNT